MSTVDKNFTMNLIEKPSHFKIHEFDTLSYQTLNVNRAGQKGSALVTIYWCFNEDLMTEQCCTVVLSDPIMFYRHSFHTAKIKMSKRSNKKGLSSNQSLFWWRFEKSYQAVCFKNQTPSYFNGTRFIQANSKWQNGWWTKKGPKWQ